MGRMHSKGKNTYMIGKAILILIYFAILAVGVYFLNKDEKYYVMVTATLIVTTLWVISIFATLHNRRHGYYASVFTLQYLLGLFIIHVCHWIYFYGLDFVGLWIILAIGASIAIIAGFVSIGTKKR
jgi:hypothetical protein